MINIDLLPALLMSFYTIFFILYIPRLRSITSQKLFSKRVISVIKETYYLQKDKIDQNLIAEINNKIHLIHNDILKNFKTKRYLNIMSRLERLFSILHNGEQNTKINTKDISSYTKQCLYKIIEYNKNTEPFANLNPKYKRSFDILDEIAEKSKNKIGSKVLRQLSEEIVLLEESFTRQSFFNKISFLVSSIGVVLTLVFGIQTFIQIST